MIYYNRKKEKYVNKKKAKITKVVPSKKKKATSMEFFTQINIRYLIAKHHSNQE